MFKAGSKMIAQSVVPRVLTRSNVNTSLRRWEAARRKPLLEYTAKLPGISAHEYESNLLNLQRNTQHFIGLTKEIGIVPVETAATLLKQGVVFDESDREAIINHAIHFNNRTLLDMISNQLKETDPSIDLLRYWVDENKGIIDPIIRKAADNVCAFFIGLKYDITRPQYYFTPLHALANIISTKNHLRILEQFITAGADINALDGTRNYYPPLLRAIRLCKKPEIALKAVQIFLANGADPNLIDRGDRYDTALHKAAKVDNLEIAAYLLENPYKKVELNAINKMGRNAAHILAREFAPNVKFLQYLIDAGIDTTVKDTEGCSVIDYLVHRKMLDQVQINQDTAKPGLAL